MSTNVELVIPEAPAPASQSIGSRASIAQGPLRLGILDNSKANADHLLKFVREGLDAALPVSSVLVLRKSSAALAASESVLNQLAVDADFVISALAD